MRAEIEDGTSVNLIFTWPAVVHDHVKFTSALLFFCQEMALTQDKVK